MSRWQCRIINRAGSVFNVKYYSHLTGLLLENNTQLNVLSHRGARRLTLSVPLFHWNITTTDPNGPNLLCGVTSQTDLSQDDVISCLTSISFLHKPWLDWLYIVSKQKSCNSVNRTVKLGRQGLQCWPHDPCSVQMANRFSSNKCLPWSFHCEASNWNSFQMSSVCLTLLSVEQFSPRAWLVKLVSS